MADVQVDAAIAAPPEAVYRLVSDVTRMGEWSPENTSCRWLGGATAAVAGARFKGGNRRGWRRWSTTCTVVTADSGRAFDFDVRYGPLPVSRWSYTIVADGDGCRVTEAWVDRRPGWMRRVSPIVMGVRDQPGHNHRTMQATLDQLRRSAEATAPTS